MKSLLIPIVLILSKFFLTFSLSAQEFSYTWGPTGMKVDVEITYNIDSTSTFVLRKATNEHSYSVISTEQSIVFIGDNIQFEQDKVTLPLNNKLYIILPFDPTISATTRINYSLDSLDSISLMIGAHDLFGLQTSSPGSELLYWCSCNMSPESPGGCGATLETLPNGKYHTRCINESNCENCVGWLAPLSSLITHGGGFIIEIKDSYAQNIAIGN